MINFDRDVTNSFLSNIFFTYLLQNADCTSPERPYCFTGPISLDRPLPNLCYGCRTSADCHHSETCQIDRSDAKCADVQLDEAPGIFEAEHGYNIFASDPLGILQETDPGNVIGRFFNQEWSETNQYSAQFCSETRHFPVNYHVRVSAECVVRGQTTVIESSSAYTREVAESTQISGEGTYNLITFGGSVGASTSQSLARDAAQGRTHTETTAQCELYSFAMVDTSQIRPTAVADSTMRTLVHTGNGNSVNHLWKRFFEVYGTHLVIEGTIGSYKKYSYTFTETQRGDMIGETHTFETAVNAGVENIAQVGGNYNSNTGASMAALLRQSHVNEVIRTKGHVEGTTEKCMDPGILKRTLSSICGHIDYNRYTNINREDCNQEMRKYCFHEIGETNFNAQTVCNYSRSERFQCTNTADCNGGYMCVQGSCRRCRLRVQMTEFCVRNDDEGRYGEYTFQINNHNYWSGDLREWHCTRNQSGWNHVDLGTDRRLRFHTIEHDRPPWNADDHGNLNHVFPSDYSCEATTYRTTTSARDQVQFSVVGVIPSQEHVLEES